MAKTKPIGVRFRPEVLEKLEREHGITSPQAALVFLERFYCQHWELTKAVTAPLRKEPKTQIKDLTKPTNEIKPVEQPKTNYSINTGAEKSEIDRAAIMAQIKAIEDEKIPKERDTLLGRGSWRIDQQKRINELKKQLI